MDPAQAMHPYEKLPLFGTGLILGLLMVAGHLLMLVKAAPVQTFLKRFPRNQQLGQVLMGLGLIWFWLLVASPGKGIFHALSMDFGDQFNAAKPILRIAVPVLIFALSIAIKEFLAVRALGLLGLMAAAPILEAHFQKWPTGHVLIPLWTYGMIIASLYFVGMPYLFRDAVSWATASASRWKTLSLAGLVYGAAVVACALLFWRGY
ncbi:hypothetical protein HNR46_000441 [Haloferula luteola]|uniref:Uncharacterized protein n=1 Tax=Haloferula luteola TaxID=595692 RepID=A0A840UVJ4_9BACT|nr:hypothetical protein [Haloferula luteola]MBB5350217.1 hypothetical protein [Haloferula luteola]